MGGEEDIFGGDKNRVVLHFVAPLSFKIVSLSHMTCHKVNSIFFLTFYYKSNKPGILQFVVK